MYYFICFSIHKPWYLDSNIGFAMMRSWAGSLTEPWFPGPRKSLNLIRSGSFKSLKGPGRWQNWVAPVDIAWAVGNLTKWGVNSPLAFLESCNSIILWLHENEDLHLHIFQRKQKSRGRVFEAKWRPREMYPRWGSLMCLTNMKDSVTEVQKISGRMHEKGTKKQALPKATRSWRLLGGGFISTDNWKS